MRGNPRQAAIPHSTQGLSKGDRSYLTISADPFGSKTYTEDQLLTAESAKSEFPPMECSWPMIRNLAESDDSKEENLGFSSNPPDFYYAINNTNQAGTSRMPEGRVFSHRQGGHAKPQLANPIEDKEATA